MGYDSRFGIFSNVALELGVQQEHLLEYRPISQVKRDQTIEFSVGASSVYYTDLSRTRLCLNVRIVDAKGDKVNDNDLVSFSNLALHSMFRQCDLLLNGQNLCGDIAITFPYKSIIDTLLEEDTEYLKSSGKTEMFYKDLAGFMDETAVTGDGGNFGLVERFKRTKGGSVVQLSGVLHADLMGITSYLPNGISLGLKLYPSMDEFCLMSGNTEKKFHVEILECKLLVQYIEPTKQLMNEHNDMLSKRPAYFPFRRSNVRCFTIPGNMTTWGVDGIFSDQIPDILTVGLVSAGAFTGKINENPYNFKNFNLSFLGFYVEGSSVNSTVHQPKFSDDLYVNEYLSLFDEKNSPGRGSIIEWDDYKNGYALYRFRVMESTQRAFAKATSCGRAGQSRLIFRFDKALPDSVIAICYARFKCVLKVDKDRNVFL
jgi:hypothetical protein